MKEVSAYQKVALHHDAPAKPVFGEPCNGCGVCCAAEPCSLAAMVLRQRHGHCAALQWQEAERRYRCGLVRNTSRYLHWVPVWLEGVTGSLCRHWIAADTRCDSDASVME